MGGAQTQQAVAHGAQGQFRPVAVAAQMPQKQVSKLGADNLFGSECRRFIGEMAVPAEDALFGAPWALEVFLEQFDVVVRFQQQSMSGAYAFNDQFGCMPQIGQETEVACGSSDEKSDRVLGVMRHAEGFYGHISHCERVACGKNPEIKPYLGMEIICDCILCEAVAINRDAQLGGDGA